MSACIAASRLIDLRPSIGQTLLCLPGDPVQPDYSIVIPVWGERYSNLIGAAIRSVREQSPEAPILVVDNAGQDPLRGLDSAQVLRLDERVSVGRARNVGLESVETEFVLVLDADDTLVPGALERLAVPLRSDRDLVAVVGRVVEGDGRRHRLPRRFAPSLARFPRLFAAVNAGWLLFPVQGCAMYRVAVARTCGGYGDTHEGDDYELAVALAAAGRIGFISDVVRRYHDPHAGLGVPPDNASLLRRARAVRERLVRRRWGRAARPFVFAVQVAAIYAVRPVVRATRRVTGRG